MRETPGSFPLGSFQSLDVKNRFTATPTSELTSGRLAETILYLQNSFSPTSRSYHRQRSESFSETNFACPPHSTAFTFPLPPFLSRPVLAISRLCGERAIEVLNFHSNFYSANFGTNLRHYAPSMELFVNTVRLYFGGCKSR